MTDQRALRTEWFLAKFIRDLRRKEPVNVGVFLRKNGEWSARFLGEESNEPERIDGRKIEHVVGSVDNYKDWIRWWRHTLQTDPQHIADCKRLPDSNYYVEYGGRVLAGNPDVSIDWLFRELVERD